MVLEHDRFFLARLYARDRRFAGRQSRRVGEPAFRDECLRSRVPNNATATLWVLASGVFVAFLFDFMLRTARSYFVDSAGKNADVVLASKLFEHVMGMRYEARPASAGALAANLREYE